MDRRVKERLIGASILVALIVLVVPELLSGSKSAPPEIRPAIAPEATRNVTLDLATSKAPASSDVEPGATTSLDPAVSAARSVAEPVPPAITSSSSVAPPTPVPVETASLSPISPRVGWAVQLGSFASRSNADNLSRQVKEQGFSVYVLPGGVGSSVRYRVRVGPLADRDSAERTAAKLKSIGHVSSLVAPAG